MLSRRQVTSPYKSILTLYPLQPLNFARFSRFKWGDSPAGYRFVSLADDTTVTLFFDPLIDDLERQLEKAGAQRLCDVSMGTLNVYDTACRSSSTS